MEIDNSLSKVSETNPLLGLHSLIRVAHKKYSADGAQLPGAEKTQAAFTNTQGLVDHASFAQG